MTLLSYQTFFVKGKIVYQDKKPQRLRLYIDLPVYPGKILSSRVEYYSHVKGSGRFYTQSDLSTGTFLKGKGEK